MSTAVLGLTCWKIGLSPIRFRFGELVISLEYADSPLHFYPLCGFSVSYFFLLLHHKNQYTDTTFFIIIMTAMFEFYRLCIARA